MLSGFEDFRDGFWGTEEMQERQREFRKKFRKQLFISETGNSYNFIVVGIYYNGNTDDFIKIIEPNLAEIQLMIENSIKDDVDYLTDYIRNHNEIIRDTFEKVRGVAESAIIANI